MRISTSKADTMVLTLKREFPLQVGEESPSRMEAFNYFRVLFMSEARDWQKDCSMLMVMQRFSWSAVAKRDLSMKVKLLLCQLSYVPTLTCGHELRRIRLWIQETDNRVSWVSLRNVPWSGARSRATSPPNWKESVKGVRTFGQDA